ncbi:MAG: MoaD/ThiS family protein [Acidobacteriota bacterium]
MARLYFPFEVAEKAGKKSLALDAPDIETLLQKGSAETGADLLDASKRCAILVNGRNIWYLKGFSTPLKPEDEVWFVAISSGG